MLIRNSNWKKELLEDERLGFEQDVLLSRDSIEL